MPTEPLHRLVIVAAIALAFAALPGDTKAVDASASASVRSSSPSAALIDAIADRPPPDVIADFVGGIAARLYTSDGARLPGHLFVLMATAGSDAPAQLFDETPYTHDYGTAADTRASNFVAAEIAEMITGIDVGHLDLTTAPGGGASTGIIYAIAYLNVVSDGAFTGDLRIAATGRLGSDGYINPISAINEKTAAAHLAGADVLFSPSASTDVHVDASGTRRVGEFFRARNTGNTLNEERRLVNYRTWGAEQPEGMDIVGVRHIADVAAYLCGAGSGYACRLLDVLGDAVLGGPSQAECHCPEDASLPARLR